MVTSAPVPAPRPILLDTDVGTDVDDAIAIGLLMASPELDLRAVTTVSGDTSLRARIAAHLLALAGRVAVPVAAGMREPVSRPGSFLWLGHEGKGILDGGESPAPLAPADGVELLIDTVLREHPHIVAIGPLSNLAVASMKEPAVCGAIPHLTLMGGALGRSAETPPYEYNLGSDAEAARLVLGAGMPTTLVPLDVTARVFLTSADLARLRDARSPLVQRLCAAIEVWAPIQRSFLDMLPGARSDIVAFLHDPLTVGLLLDPSFATFESLRLRPIVSDGLFRLIEDRTAPAVDVAVAVDAARFVDFLLERLCGLP